MTAATTTGLDVRAEGLTVRFGDTTALDGVALSVPAGSITGLLGRNGSGKTTLLSAIASFRRPTEGRVLVDGEDPFENERLMEQICLVRESGDVLHDERLTTNLEYFATTRPTWDDALAERLLETFQLDAAKKVSQLSRGQRSAFGITMGLASRAPLTMLDEVHLGMDAPSRYAFYDALLEDYVAHPRTIVLSSHLISELDRLLEHVVVLDRGSVLLTSDADDLRARGATITGRTEDVDATVRTLDDVTVLSEHTLGSTKQVAVMGQGARLTPATTSAVRDAGLELGQVELQDLVVHLTGRKS
ncbi:ABC transporter ATP-binding protein [Georgenia alba]|uniref:ABC transporter ATP-binding protein n=1 Tax=Georgenia alba TaxID=2233858 RepID=A0ABW2QBE2_9MICO